MLLFLLSFFSDLYRKTSKLSRATYINTYSGDAPMDAGWINLICMKNHNKPKQINGLEGPTGEVSKSIPMSIYTIAFDFEVSETEKSARTTVCVSCNLTKTHPL